MVKQRSFFIGRLRLCRNPRPPDASPVIPPCVPWHRSFSAHLDHISVCQASGLGFVAQPSNLTVLWWTASNLVCRLRSWATTLHRLLSTTSSCISCYNVARTWSRSPTGSIEPEPTCLSTLHMHQRKSRRNLHLQYSAKSQSPPRCQSLITLESDHLPVLRRSSTQSPPWWVHWQHT
jgi:hypothetical protein